MTEIRTEEITTDVLKLTDELRESFPNELALEVATTVYLVRELALLREELVSIADVLRVQSANHRLEMTRELAEEIAIFRAQSGPIVEGGPENHAKVAELVDLLLEEESG